MGIKTEVDLSDFNLKAIKQEVVDIAQVTLLQILEDKIITDNILKGKSPVKGQGKFEKYSPSYTKKIQKGGMAGKSVRPVNLKVTGELLDSFYIDAIDGGLEIGFDNDLADIHNRLGASKKKVVRRMLPDLDLGEKFNRDITKAIESELKEIVEKVTDKMSKANARK